MLGKGAAGLTGGAGGTGSGYDVDRMTCGRKDGPLFTRIRRFDTPTNDWLTDRAVYHVLQVRQRRGLQNVPPHDL